MNQMIQQPEQALTAPATLKINPKHRFAFIHARWHGDIVQNARNAFISEMLKHGVAPEAIDEFGVPGAFEIPLHAKKLADSGQYSAIVACALIVDGGIYRHEFVSTAVIDGLMRVQLETEVPVISAALTPKSFHDHADHQRFFSEHFLIKGGEAARACLETVMGLDQLARLKLTQQKTGTSA
ncbi:MAG: 6,7-dimethyl-8-ribityllumazine synthase [Burkholderiaceae bacterium]